MDELVTDVMPDRAFLFTANSEQSERKILLSTDWQKELFFSEVEPQRQTKTKTNYGAQVEFLSSVLTHTHTQMQMIQDYTQLLWPECPLPEVKIWGCTTYHLLPGRVPAAQIIAGHFGHVYVVIQVCQGTVWTRREVLCRARTGFWMLLVSAWLRIIPLIIILSERISTSDWLL